MEYTDTVPVLAGHLDELLSALEAAEGLATALDLEYSYRRMRPTSPSILTTRLQTQLERVQGYLGGPENERIPEE